MRGLRARSHERGDFGTGRKDPRRFSHRQAVPKLERPAGHWPVSLTTCAEPGTRLRSLTSGTSTLTRRTLPLWSSGAHTNRQRTRSKLSTARVPLPLLVCKTLAAIRPRMRVTLAGWRTRIELLTQVGPAPAQGKGAALIIGHDPGMGCLLTTLLRLNAPRIRRYRDVPALTRAELIALRWDRRYWLPMWALTPGASNDISEIKAKIKSKMDSAKVFGGFVTGVLTFVISQYATTQPKTTYWAAARGASLTALAVAILLYLMTLFWYDRLLMPSRFWGVLEGRQEDAVSKVMRRPPSSAVWVLYQNMQRTWRLLFVPATYAAAIGIIGFAAGRIQPSGTTALISFAVAVAVVAITAWWGWRSRPVLGVQD